ncbi:membrane-anchored junction protein isoform X2 [Harpia harpyja]|uniref:membrane-anchored junction protein isoform X2 n=1 Tax=Harpia harpyja TaxID=202280 RepID=UPI0022B097EA|nr:membrane-anchored junction protein isoform X2 [Harpia harpyja]
MRTASSEAWRDELSCNLCVGLLAAAYLLVNHQLWESFKPNSNEQFHPLKELIASVFHLGKTWASSPLFRMLVSASKWTKSICVTCFFLRSEACKEVNKGSDELVKRRNEVSESAAVEETVKRIRVEVGAEASRSQSGMDRTGAECVRHTSKAEHGFEMNSSKENEREFSPASLTVGGNQMSLWGHVGSNLEQRTGTGQAEGAVQLLQQMDQMINKGNVESGGRGLSRFWRSIIFSPLQHLFGGKN